MYSLEVREQVIKLHHEGNNYSKISKTLNISRFIIKEWITGNKRHVRKNEDEILSSDDFFKYFITNIENSEEYRKSYYYLLGQYLGDGCITEMKNKRTYRLRIACADKYPKIIEELKYCLNVIFPYNKIQEVQSVGCKMVGIYNTNLPLIFPQHGTGKKHNRNIKLIDWQEKYLQHNELAKGLFHSDGCYFVNKIKNKKTLKYREYPTYWFTNCSEDLHNIFQTCLISMNVNFRFEEQRRVNIQLKSKIWHTKICKIKDINKLKDIIGIKQ